VALESAAIWLALLGAVVGSAVGWVAFAEHRPSLSGQGSVADLAAVTTASTAGIACLLGYLYTSRTTNQWILQRARAWIVVDLVGLIVVHAAIAMMASLALFRVFQDAFIGLRVGPIAGAVMLGLVTAIAGYFGFTSSARMTARSLSSLLAVFMTAGMLMSMLLAENPFWWHAFFSELGTGQAGTWSFWTFNTTLAVSGLVLITLTRFITQALYSWARGREAKGGRRARVWVLRWGLCVVGLCLIGAGLVPINLSDPVHSTFMRILVVVFMLVLITIPLWLPGFPTVFYLATLAMVALSVLAAALWYPLRYYNLTGFELAMAGIIYAWLVVFIRSVDALVDEAPQAPRPPGSGSSDRERSAPH
jgi:hypothetical protein